MVTLLSPERTAMKVNSPRTELNNYSLGQKSTVTRAKVGPTLGYQDRLFLIFEIMHILEIFHESIGWNVFGGRFDELFLIAGMIF